jgi:hypothetical protein
LKISAAAHREFARRWSKRSHHSCNSMLLYQRSDRAHRHFADVLEDRKKLESKQNELIKAHYAGAVVLLVAAAGFLALVFVLNRAFDFSRFVY